MPLVSICTVSQNLLSTFRLILIWAELIHNRLVGRGCVLIANPMLWPRKHCPYEVDQLPLSHCPLQYCQVFSSLCGFGEPSCSCYWLFPLGTGGCENCCLKMSWILLLSMGLGVCGMCSCSCESVCWHMRLCVPSSALHLIFWSRVPQWTWSSLVWPGLLTTEL